MSAPTSSLLEVLFHAVGEYVCDAHQQHDEEGGAQLGNGDVPHLLEPARAVHRCRLIESGVNAGDGGDIDDGAPAQALLGAPQPHLQPHMAAVHEVVSIGSDV